LVPSNLGSVLVFGKPLPDGHRDNGTKQLSGSLLASLPGRCARSPVALSAHRVKQRGIGSEFCPYCRHYPERVSSVRPRECGLTLFMTSLTTNNTHAGLPSHTPTYLTRDMVL
jgi:hypothetical protein